jgi:flagellar P-ring protein precursor FlgI
LRVNSSGNVGIGTTSITRNFDVYGANNTNGLGISGNTTGNRPILGAVGGDTNIGINYTAKGTPTTSHVFSDGSGIVFIGAGNGGTAVNYLNLKNADGQVYAVAQGSVSSGFSAGGASGSSFTKGVPTSGRIANGAIVEREINFHLADLSVIRLSLRNPDFTTAGRVADAINKHMKSNTAVAVDSTTVRLAIPDDKRGNVVGIMSDIEQLPINPDQIAKVVIDEQSGVIVMGENVHINTVAIAQGNLTIKISETPQISQPGPLSQGGTTARVERSDVSVDEGKGAKLALVKNGVSLQELVQSLNALGIGPRDMISILQSVKASGALQADLELM